MAHNQEEFDKHSNDNNEILHIDRGNQNTSPVWAFQTTYKKG